MDKDKIIKVLKSLPQEFYDNAYIVSMRDNMVLMLQMKYNAKLVKVLYDSNRWTHNIDNNGFIDFIRNDGIKITMT